MERMHVVLVIKAKIPALKYGGTERVVYDLGDALVKMGHQVTFIASEGSFSTFARVISLNPTKKIEELIPHDADIVHFNHQPEEPISKPYLVTMHGNHNDPNYQLNSNTVFVSKNHANRFGSDVYVYNGLNWDNYGRPDLTTQQNYFHFLGKAAWRVKNIRGAIKVCQKNNFRLKVLGGVRFNLKMGLRLTFDPRISFEGMVDDAKKRELLPHSRGLIFPVLWHEPFGLAITESLYFGVPVFGTPYGSLTELVPNNVGYLTNSASQLTDALKNWPAYSRNECHEYAASTFNANTMARNYLHLYEKVLNGESLNALQPHLLEKQHEKFLPWLE